mgnify:FL=1
MRAADCKPVQTKTQRSGFRLRACQKSVFDTCKKGRSGWNVLFLLVEQPHQDPNSVPMRSCQARSSAFHADSCRARPVYPRTHRRWCGPLSPTMLSRTSYCERSMCRIGNGHTAEVAAAKGGFGHRVLEEALVFRRMISPNVSAFILHAPLLLQQMRGKTAERYPSGTQQSSAHPYRGKIMPARRRAVPSSCAWTYVRCTGAHTDPTRPARSCSGVQSSCE